MIGQPLYYAWYPYAEKPDVLSVLLVPGSSSTGPSGGRPFIESVLSACAIRARVAAWGVEPLLTTYFTGQEWQECWEVRLLLESELQLEGGIVRGAPVEASPEAMLPETPSVRVSVVADFKSLKAAKACRDELRAQSARAKWDEIHYERYHLRSISNGQRQLVIDLRTALRSELTAALEAAPAVVAACTSFGGVTAAQDT